MSNLYDQNAAYWLKKFSLSKTLIRLIEESVKPNDNILDIGCGGGRLTKAVRSMVSGIIVGVDFSSHLIDAARAMQAEFDPNLVYIHGDVEKAETWNKVQHHFDVVVSNTAIRKDHCRLNKIVEMLHQHQPQHPIYLVAKIQSNEDLPGIIDGSPFYSAEEILSILPGVDIIQETFLQRFSSGDYLQTFLDRIGVSCVEPQVWYAEKRLVRCYHLVAGKING